MVHEFNHLKSPFRYRPDIDGLRALAVIPVLLYHAGLGCPGGFVGVDVFFVISGYLITSLIAREMVTGEFRFRDFWERRIRRIMPPALLVTLVTVVVGWWVLLPEEYGDLGKAAVAQVAGVANFYFWQQGGYFAGPSDLEPLLHMWSLAVEEQFYLFLPLLLLFLIKRGEKNTRIVLVLLFGASLLWSFYGVEHAATASFYLLPARAWELLLGSLLAILPYPRLKEVWGYEAFGILGLGLILFSIGTYDLTTPFPGLSAIPPCLGTALIIYAGSTQSCVVSRILSWTPLTFIGKISFSLYLWHWPLLVYGRYLSIAEISLSVRIGLVLAAFVLAVFTWLLVETPFRKKKFASTQPILFRYFWQSTVFALLLFTAVYKMDGIPTRMKGNDTRFISESIKPTLEQTKEDFTELPLILPTSEAQTLPILIWGDSHANVMLALFQDLFREKAANGFYSSRFCNPPLLGVNRLPDDSLALYNDKVLLAIDRLKIRRVILIARWSRYYHLGENSREDPLTDRDSSQRSSGVVFQDALRVTIQQLRDRNIDVVLLKQVPQQHRNPCSALWMSDRFGYDPEEAGVTVEQHLAHQMAVNEIFDDLDKPGISTLDPLEVLQLKNGHTKIQESGELYYFDDNHLSREGAKALRPLFENFISPL